MIKACNSTHWWIDDVGEVQSETYKTKRKDKGCLYFLVSQRRLNGTSRISNSGIGV